MKDVRELTVFTPIVSTPTVAAGEFSLFPSPSSASTSREESRGKGGRPGMVSSSPSFAADIDRGRKKNTTLSLFSNIGSWAKPRRESSPSVAPTPATPDLPLEDLIEALTPPAVQSPQQARALAQAISSQGVVIPFPQFNPIVSALCAPDAPAPCQVAGWDVLTAYWRRASEDASASTLGWPELLAHFSLISISQAWTLESWEPRHAALLAVISSPHGVLGLEQDLVLLLRLWIEGAFSRMTTGEIVSLEERSERERSVEVLSKHLISVLVNTQVASRLGQEVIDTLLLSFEHMIKSALTLDPQPMTSPAAVQSPAASGANSTPPRLPLHRRRQSSHITPLLSPGEATLKIPLDCIIDVYVSFLASQSARLSFKHLESTLPLLCRVLAYYNAPIPVPSAVIDAQSYPSSPYYKRVAEVLSSSFPGVHAMFARRIIRRCMFPSAEAKQDMLAAIQVSTGAFRVLRIFVRQTLRERLDARADAQGRSWTSSTEFTDEVDVNLGAYSFHPSQSGRALRDAIRAWLEIDCLGLSREPVLEEAAGIVNDVLNVFDARELPDMQSDEANAMGGALLEVAQYVKQFK
jgi:tuberous sclerosis protein 2